MIPGSNLLKMALRAIAPTTVTYYQWITREANAIGLLVNDFDEGTCISGSLQPVPRSLYQQLNLDFEKNYYMFYSVTPFQTIERDTSSDQIGFGDKRFQVVSSADWHAIDGWNGIMMVEV
jgi:E217 collar protein gp28